MNSKKCFVLVTTLATFLIGLHTTLWGQEQKDPTEKVKLLEEKIKRLENVVETQQKTISRIESEKAALQLKLDEQTKENERLKNLCSQAGIDISPQEDKKPLKDKSENVIDVSIEQLREFVKKNRISKTHLQQEELYKKNYEGKRVQWTGSVESVSDYAKVKMRPAGLEYYIYFIYKQPDLSQYLEVTLRLPKDESLKQRLLSLNKGSLVTYQGKLPRFSEINSLIGSGGSASLTLTEGRIVSVDDRRQRRDRRQR